MAFVENEEQQVDSSATGATAAPGSLHHVELWVPDLARAITQWEWLLGELGYALYQDWPDGRSWRLGSTYLVIEQSPALTACDHDRLPSLPSCREAPAPQ